MAKHRDFLSWQLRTQNLKPHSRESGNPVVDNASRQQTWIPAFAGMDETMIKTKYFIKTAPLSGEFFGGPFKAVLLESGGKAIWIFSKIEDV